MHGSRWARWCLLAGMWLVVFAVVVGQAIVILTAHLPAATALTVYLGVLAMDIAVILLVSLWWNNRQ